MMLFAVLRRKGFVTKLYGILSRRLSLSLASANGGHHPDPELYVSLNLTLDLTRGMHAWLVCKLVVVVIGNSLFASRAHLRRFA